MATLIILVSVVLCLVQAAAGQGGNQYYYSSACGPQLQDIPNPASDSCTAFFRCYQNQQFSVRCPAGQAFDFNKARCRPANIVDCPLQLQRFQAPGIPHYLRPAGAADDSRLEIRVIQLGNDGNPNNLVFLDGDGQRMPVSTQVGNGPQALESQIRSHPVNPYLRAPIHQSPVAAPSGRTPTAVQGAGAGIPTEGRPTTQNQRPQTNQGQPGPNPNVAFPLQ